MGLAHSKGSVVPIAWVDMSPESVGVGVLKTGGLPGVVVGAGEVQPHSAMADATVTAAPTIQRRFPSGRPIRAFYLGKPRL